MFRATLVLLPILLLLTQRNAFGQVDTAAIDPNGTSDHKQLEAILKHEGVFMSYQSFLDDRPKDVYTAEYRLILIDKPDVLIHKARPVPSLARELKDAWGFSHGERTFYKDPGKSTCYEILQKGDSAFILAPDDLGASILSRVSVGTGISMASPLLSVNYRVIPTGSYVWYYLDRDFGNFVPLKDPSIGIGPLAELDICGSAFLKTKVPYTLTVDSIEFCSPGRSEYIMLKTDPTPKPRSICITAEGGEPHCVSIQMDAESRWLMEVESVGKTDFKIEFLEGDQANLILLDIDAGRIKPACQTNN